MKISVRFTLLYIGIAFMCLALTNISDALEPTSFAAIWTLDEGAGDKVADMSGNGYDGAFASGEPQWVKGKFGMALDFDGVDDWVEMNDPVVKETVDFTMGCWVNPGDTQKTWTNILSSHQEPPRRGISFEQIENNVNLFGVALGDGTNWAGAENFRVQLITGEWNHMVVVRSGDQGTWYLNGEVAVAEKYASGDPVVAATSNFRIGNWVLGGREFNGTVDEVFLINEALSADQVKTIMSNGIIATETAVSPAEKTATTWGRIKRAH